MNPIIAASFALNKILLLTIAAFIGLILIPSYQAVAEENGIVFEKNYLKESNSVVQKSIFNIIDTTDEYYLSVENNKGHCSFAEIKINGKKVTSLLNLKLKKKNLLPISLKSTNEIAVNIRGTIGSEVKVKIVRLSAFDTIFGPQEISPSKAVSKFQFTANDTISSHILVIDLTESNKLAIGDIKLNNKKIVNVLDFALNKKKKIFKLIDVQSQNTLSITFIGNQKTKAKISVLGPTIGDAIKNIIPVSGGKIDLKNVASVRFDQNNFTVPTEVMLSKASTIETKEDFDVSSLVFGVTGRNEYEVKIKVGPEQPKGLTEINLTVPDEFINSFTTEDEIQILGQIYQESEFSTYDNFEIIDSIYDAGNKTVTFYADSTVYTNTRRIDGNFEAIFVIAKTPSQTIISSNYRQNLAIQSDASCKGATLGNPLHTGDITGSFNPPNHMGTDFRATPGTNVMAMATGVIEHIGFDLKNIPNPRIGKNVRGWGKFIVIKHADGSRTLYAHLKENAVYVGVGAPVTKGQAFAQSGNSGATSGPHLHIEYAINGKTFNDSKKIDAASCIEKIINEITVSNKRDANGTPGWGNDYSTSLTLHISKEQSVTYSTLIGKTLPGETKTFPVPPLIPGKYYLWVYGEFEPDEQQHTSWWAKIEVAGKLRITERYAPTPTTMYLNQYINGYKMIEIEILP